MKCFNAPLQPEELLGVKKVVQDKMPNVRRALAPDNQLIACSRRN